MMVKWLEIRDRWTTIPALALHISEADGWLAERAGYGPDGCVLLINLARLAIQYDPYEWDRRLGRTMHVAHCWLAEHFDEVQNRQVLDVEFLMGETARPKLSEQRQ